jgi:hypothetical protein
MTSGISVITRLAARWAALLLGALAASAATAEPSPAPTVAAFVNVNVVPMDAERVLRNQTVLVEDGKIEAVGTSLPVPANARVIDGHGTAYLSPGLADMHVHADTRRDMALYLANGVTTVLNMGEASNGFVGQTLPEINAGRIPGPHVYVSFLVDGTPEYGHFVVKTPEEARALIGLARTNGYDFIKVYNNLSPECFQALVEEGRRQGIAVIGHGVTRVGLEKQLDTGQVMVAHTEEFLYTTFAHPGDGPPDPALIPHAIDFIKRDRAFVTADLNTYATISRQWGRPEVVRGFLDAPEARYLSPDRRLSWAHGGYDRRKGDLTPNLEFLKGFTKALSDAGVPLITGTDSPSIPGLAPGWSLHADMDALQAAGLSRYQVLTAATRTPGEFIVRTLKGAEPFGTVTPGARADLILSEANPLEDLSTLRRPLGVMANGRWYARANLEALLDRIADDYDRASAHP